MFAGSVQPMLIVRLVLSTLHLISEPMPRGCVRAPMLFPWFVEARNRISVFAHVLFGVAVAGAYVAPRDRHD